MALSSKNISAFASPLERYLFKPFLGSSHIWALEELDSLSPNQSVLDIGAGQGAMGRALRDRGFKEIFAVEIDSTACNHLRSIYSEVVETTTSFKEKKFDAILLLDVLEHLSHPEPFLSEAASLLKEGGFILISVPNIAHRSVRFPLLFGKFDYQERGILDKTHLHFFTVKHLRQVVARTGLQKERENASIEPVEFLLPSWIPNTKVFKLLARARLALANALPGLFGYQLLVKLRKQENPIRETLR